MLTKKMPSLQTFFLRLPYAFILFYSMQLSLEEDKKLNVSNHYTNIRTIEWFRTAVERKNRSKKNFVLVVSALHRASRIQSTKELTVQR